MSGKKINIRTKKLGIGPRIKQYRELKGLKVEAFSKVIRVAHGTVSNIENEVTTPSAKTLQKTCQYTNVDSRWLLTGKRDQHRGGPGEEPTQEIQNLTWEIECLKKMVSDLKNEMDGHINTADHAARHFGEPKKSEEM